MALAKIITASHHDALPRISDTTGNSTNLHANSNKGPPLKETARRLRAKRNLSITSGKHHHHRPLHRRRRRPSYSSEDGSDNDQQRDAPSNEERHVDDDGSLSSKETAQPLSAPKASNKRHHSSSSIPRTKLGSKENPIDVDSVASLFEPMVTREYVRIFFFSSAHAEYMLQMKKEIISLPHETNPPIKGNKSFTVYDVEGNPESFTPSFHVSSYKWVIF